MRFTKNFTDQVKLAGNVNLAKYSKQKLTTLQDIYFWNSCTGEHYSYMDQNCPVVAVGSIVNNENIWFNIQHHERPAQLRYDVCIK